MQVNDAIFSSMYVETESIFQCTHERDGDRFVCSFAHFMQHTFFSRASNEHDIFYTPVRQDRLGIFDEDSMMSLDTPTR